MYIQFFFVILVASTFQLLLPLGNCLKNTKFHSGDYLMAPAKHDYSDQDHSCQA